MIPPAAPGAPSTIAVDTSENAMRNIGSTSRPPSRRPSGSNMNTNTTVSVNKVGSSQAPPPAANVRVSVNKIG